MEKKPIHLLCFCPIYPAAVKCAGCAYITGVWRGTAVHLFTATGFFKTKLPEDRKCWPERFSAGMCIYALVSMTESILLSRGAIVVAMEPK